MNRKQTPKIPTEFINLQSDFGFKRTYGTQRFSKNVIRLLNAALGDDIVITRLVPRDEPDTEEDNSVSRDVIYHDKEILPSEIEGKRIVYDVYFTMKTGAGESMFKPHHLLDEDKDKDVEHHFILEMQNGYEPPFEDRMTYYVSKIIAGQGEAGWNYDLDPVILICITTFDFKHLQPKMEHEFELRDRTTGESLTKKLRMLFYSLKQIPERWEDCKTDLEKELYLIKNMDKMDKNSRPYLEGGYEDLFNAAESELFAAEDVVLYSNSLSRMRAMKSGFDFQYKTGREEGREEGRQEGREEGFAIGANHEREIMVRNMKKLGYDVDSIAAITGLSPDRIREL